MKGQELLKGSFRGVWGRGDVQSSSGNWSCSGLISSISTVWSTTFNSGVTLSPFPWGQFMELRKTEQFTSWLQSSHRVINISHLMGVSVFKDVAQTIIYSPWGGTKCPWLCLMVKLSLFCLDCFPLFLHFLISLIKFIHWLNYSD